MVVYSNRPRATLPNASARPARWLKETVLRASLLEVEFDAVPLSWMALAWNAAKVFALDSFAFTEKTCGGNKALVSGNQRDVRNCGVPCLDRSGRSGRRKPKREMSSKR